MTRNEKSAGAIVYYMDEKPYFLLLKYKSYWGFAKGLIEEIEEIGDTVRREIKEEAGISDIKILQGFKYPQSWYFKFENELVRKEATFFIAKTTKEQAENTEISFEHEDFCWKTYDEAIKFMKIKQNKEMLEKANEFIKQYESQKQLI